MNSNSIDVHNLNETEVVEIRSYSEYLKFYLNSNGLKLKRNTLTFDGSPYILVFEKPDQTMLEVRLIDEDSKGTFYRMMRNVIVKSDIKRRIDLRF